MATYVSSARTSLNELQRVVDTHAISSADGRCMVCHLVGPCQPLEEALGELTRWHQLPRRRAGATRPELINARRVTGVRNGLGGTGSYRPRHHSRDAQ